VIGRGQCCGLVSVEQNTFSLSLLTLAFQQVLVIVDLSIGIGLTSWECRYMIDGRLTIDTAMMTTIMRGRPRSVYRPRRGNTANLLLFTIQQGLFTEYVWRDS